MGFRFATVCLKDPRAGQYRARVSFGAGEAKVQGGFVFPIASSRDLFHLAMENDADLMIEDAASPKIRDLLPAWHRQLLPDAKSFIVLPLVVGKVQLGLFYADRTRTAPEGVPPDETSLIKALKGQVLAALASATTPSPSEWARPMVAATIEASFGLVSMSLTKPRSILMRSIANSFR
jgi:hypothetical protein